MNTSISNGMPTANLAINKSRLKLYNKESNTPTYYLQKGQEFQIELFNPTQDTILAKIQLNGKLIAQGGLVIRPGERVFLERYIDVAKKFLFDTYEVANSSEARAAIEHNGDFKVEFYKEKVVPQYNPFILRGPSWTNLGYNNGSTAGGWANTTGTVFNDGLSNGASSFYTSNINTSYDASIGLRGTITTSGFGGASASMDSLSEAPMYDQKSRPRSRRLLKKSIETGIVEAGSDSNQKLEYVTKSFESYPFHTLEYKMLPVSQKVNTAEDLKVRRYCTNCGEKQKAEYKFCPKCGTKS